jgi:hypothetical protein
MPDLIHSLQSRDLGHLRIVAGLWGVELVSTEVEDALGELCAALLAPDRLRETLDLLPVEAASALAALIEAGGRIPWAAFARQYGEIRDAGPGRRDREQVHLHPISAGEALFYRALLARAFFDTPSGAQEFAYIPDDLVKILHHEGHAIHKGEEKENFVTFVPFVVKKDDEPLGRAATPKERARPLPADDRLLDDATTLLAALRMGIAPPETPIPLKVVGEFLRAAGILLPSPERRGAGGEVQAEKVKSFLEVTRGAALSMLVNAWRESESFNELRQLPSLMCEGEWSNSPLVTRHMLLALINAIPQDQWWSLPAFIRDIKEKHPDFQRPAGDYDSWFIRRAGSETYLRGFEHWDDVDGALVHYLITGPLFWLGMVELAMPEESESITAFRMASNVQRRTSDVQHSTLDETGTLHVSSQGKITIPRSTPRAARYQIARFCEWEDAKPDKYRYRVTTASLTKAKAQGLKVSQLLSLLAKNAASEIPPAFVKALKRWELHGTEARVENPVILSVSRPEVLEVLRKSKAGRFLGEILGPTTVIVKKGAQPKVLAALAELGMLAEEVN